MKESGRRKITLCICAGNRSHDLKLFKSFVSFLTLFHFVCFFFFSFFIFKILVEQEDEWGENFGFFELFVGGYEVDTL